MKRFGRFLLFAGVSVALTACMAGSAPSGEMANGDWLAHLLLGFWHGMIAPVTLTLQLLRERAPEVLHVLPPQFWGEWSVYENRAGDFAYNVGFCFGLFFLPAFMWPRPRF